MERLLTEITIDARDTQLILLPNKMVWWPDQRALILADTHFGKASTFRQAGIPVPAGTTTSMLRAISDEIDRRSAETLIVVGDFIHSSISSERDFELELNAWRSEYMTLRVILIRGNHDRRSEQFYESINVDVQPGLGFELRGLHFCHYPEFAADNAFTICGHWHPAIRIGTGAIRESVACYLLSKHRLILPAFGEFTGRANVQLNVGDVAYLIVADKLATLPANA